jgi:peptidyl-prolyl cis-trans isomerase C
MATASARHILVDSEEKCNELKEQINSGEITFEQAAKENSTCPSGANGGDLGTFSQGQMVPEFDKVVFNDEVGVVHGPVKTQFGYHLLEVTSRS